MPKTKLADLVEKKGFIVTDQDVSVGEALKKWKKMALPAKISHAVYVIDSEDRLVGIAELRELLLGEPGAALKEIMNMEFQKVEEKQSVSQALSVAVNSEVTDVPVVDKENRLVGVVSVEKLVDSLNWINTKNIYNLAGILRAQEEVDLRLSSIFRAVWGRLVWLLFSVLVGVFIAGGIIKEFEAAIVTVPAVTFFIPVLMGFGGNMGTQTSTIFVRLLAKKDPAVTRQLKKLFMADLITGVLLGFILGGITAASAMFLFTDFDLGVALLISMFFISILSVVVGFLIPYACSKLNLDPAIVSAPMVTTIKDILALLVYFTVLQMLI